VVLAMSNVLNPYLLGIVAGIGSGIGEITGYIAGGGAVQIINNKNEQYKKFEILIKKYDMPAIFVLAFTPNPLFDIAGIVAGTLKIPYWRYILPCILGRAVRYVLLAYLGTLALGLLS
jgi:membrane protein YqaA with SNARE-associated domain